MSRTWVVENTWVCTSCQHKNLGRHVACQGCGNPKDKGERDVVSNPSAPEVTDPELLRLARQGPNWVCEYCGGQVRDENGKCVKNCGAPRPGTAEKEVEERTRSEPLPEPSKPASDPPRAAAWPPPSRSLPPRPRPAPVPDPKRFRRALIVGGVIAGVAAFAGLLTWLLTPREVETKVASIQWTYRSDLRQRTLMHGEDWGSPSGAFNVSCHSKYYGTRNCNPHNCNPHSVSYSCNCTSYQCNCHTTCSDNGNGFSTCRESCSTCQRCETCSRTEYDTCYDQCPVYKDWCSYDYYEWPIIKTLTTSGANHEEYWPTLAADGPLQRLDRTEKYEVHFYGAKDHKDWSYAPKSLAEFNNFYRDETWKIRVNRLGIVTPLTELEGDGVGRVSTNGTEQW